MDKSLLSIVIANYNYGRFLEDAIRSIIYQDGFDQCELIIVDGGSTDDSIDVIRKYENKITWWGSEKDKGQSDAFNKGFSHASGEFGCWVNADDILLPGAIRAVLNVIAKGNVDWVGGGMVWMDSNMRIIRCSHATNVPRVLFPYLPGYIVGGPSSFFRLSALCEAGGFDVGLHYAMDTDLWYRFMDRGLRLKILNRCLWTFRLHEQSKTAWNFSALGGGERGEPKDFEIIRGRYPSHMDKQDFMEKVLRFLKVVNGTYFRSWVDTKRYAGRMIEEYQA